MTGRDLQRSRVYAAETVVRRMLDRADAGTTLDLHGSTITLPPERRFASAESVEHYAARVLSLNWVRSAWPARAAVPVTVRERRGNARAEYERDGATIAIPPFVHNTAWAMRELVVLHELAHHVADDPAEEAHGPAFLDRLLTLVDGIVGPEVALLLRTTLADAGARLSLVPTR